MTIDIAMKTKIFSELLYSLNMMILKKSLIWMILLVGLHLLLLIDLEKVGKQLKMWSQKLILIDLLVSCLVKYLYRYEISVYYISTPKVCLIFYISLGEILERTAEISLTTFERFWIWQKFYGRITSR